MYIDNINFFYLVNLRTKLDESLGRICDPKNLGLQIYKSRLKSLAGCQDSRPRVSDFGPNIWDSDIYLFICFIYLSIYLFIYVLIYFIYLSIYLFIYLFILCFKVDLHLAYEKPISINKNSAYISVNRLPSNDDNNKTKYLLVRQNQHVAIRIFAWEIRLSYFDFLIFSLKHFRLLQFLITLGTSVHIFGAV